MNDYCWKEKKKEKRERIMGWGKESWKKMEKT